MVRNRKGDDRLLELVEKRPLARSLLVFFYSKSPLETDISLVKKFYSMYKKFNDAGTMTVVEAYRSQNAKERKSKLEQAAIFFQQDPRFAFWAQVRLWSLFVFDSCPDGNPSLGLQRASQTVGVSVERRQGSAVATNSRYDH